MSTGDQLDTISNRLMAEHLARMTIVYLQVGKEVAAVLKEYGESLIPESEEKECDEQRAPGRRSKRF